MIAFLLLLGAFTTLVGAEPSTRPATTRPAEDAPVRVRVLSYNIHHAAGTDGRIDLPRMAQIIRQSEADLVALQEVDVKTKRVDGVDQLAELERLTGLSARFGKAMDYQGGAYGQAILSRWPIESFHVERLPGPAEVEPRIAVIATVPAEGRRPAIVLAGTHFDHQREAARVSQARQLVERLAHAPAGASIIAGDLNAIPASRTMEVFGGTWTSATADDALTHPATQPNKKIDWVLLPSDSPWRVVDARVLDEPVASDHLPVLVELELRSAQPATAP